MWDSVVQCGLEPQINSHQKEATLIPGSERDAIGCRKLHGNLIFMVLPEAVLRYDPMTTDS
jgi:hypothetical protein